MRDPEPPEGGGQAEPDRSFARLRHLLRLIRRPRDGESLRDTIDEMIEEPSTEGPHPLSAHERVLIQHSQSPQPDGCGRDGATHRHCRTPGRDALP